MKYRILTLYFLFLHMSLSAQQYLTIPERQNNVLYTENTGQIRFLDKKNTLENCTDKDFIDTIVLTDSTDLYMAVFMDNTVTNYLHEIDTSLSIRQLHENGNFQFNFWVDNRLIYTENLNTGAGTVSFKNHTTAFIIPLISRANEDSWGRYLWMRFYAANGGEDQLFSGKHYLRIEIKPYLKVNNKIQTGKLIAAGTIITERPAIHITGKQKSIQPILPNSGWKESKDEYKKEYIIEMNQKILEKRFREITSVVVIKNNELLIEEYFNDYNRECLHDTRSVGKSFASALTGIAIRNKHLKDEYQLLKQYYNLREFNNYSSKKDSVTLQSLLTMSSGFEGSDQDQNSPGNEENMYPLNDWINFTLDLPMNNDKQIGKTWDYFTAGVVLLGDILNKVVPGGLEKYAAKHLFQPLEIQKYEWQYTPEKIISTAGGLRLRSLDLAKFGQLYQNQGRWNNHQLISKKWVNKSFSNYFPGNGQFNGYGYLFWRELFDIKGRKYEAFACSGNGGNKIFIFKEIPIVIVITATAYNKPYAHAQAGKMMLEHLLPAILP